jgi:hypothetical protein
VRCQNPFSQVEDDDAQFPPVSGESLLEIPFLNLANHYCWLSTVTFSLSTMKFALFLASAFAAAQLGSSFVGKLC